MVYSVWHGDSTVWYTVCGRVTDLYGTVCGRVTVSCGTQYVPRLRYSVVQCVSG